MAGHTQAGKQSLTGVWQGLYTYSDGTSVAFVATLIDSGSALTGSTHELCTAGAWIGSTIYATLSGSRQGSAIAFTKIYDEVGFEYQSAVKYEGTLSGDEMEIEGRWIIHSMRFGKFLMIRSNGKTTEIQRKVTARI
jgi:hypothetical protein